MDFQEISARLSENTQRNMQNNGIGYLLNESSNHLGAISFDNSSKQEIIPILECGSGLLIIDRKTLKSNRRRSVFAVHDSVFKTGEISLNEDYHKSMNEQNDKISLDNANYHLIFEVNNKLSRPNLIEGVTIIISDTKNKILYLVEPKKITLDNLARTYNPIPVKMIVKNIEEAAINFYKAAEKEGVVYNPRIINKRVDLGDLLVSKNENGDLEIKVTDNPLFKPFSKSPIDNSQSFTLVLSSFFDKMRNRRNNNILI